MNALTELVEFRASSDTSAAPEKMMPPLALDEIVASMESWTISPAVIVDGSVTDALYFPVALFVTVTDAALSVPLITSVPVGVVSALVRTPLELNVRKSATRVCPAKSSSSPVLFQH